MKSAIAAALGADRLDDISSFYLADEFRGLMLGCHAPIAQLCEREFGRR